SAVAIPPWRRPTVGRPWVMPARKTGWITVIFGTARMILHDRPLRRRLLAWMLGIALAQMAIGLWVIDRWLMADPWRFLLWWAVCAVVTCSVLLFAVYDALAVVREERERFFFGDDRSE